VIDAGVVTRKILSEIEADNYITNLKYTGLKNEYIGGRLPSESSRIVFREYKKGIIRHYKKRNGGG
jgi:hypothetical protein